MDARSEFELQLPQRDIPTANRLYTARQGLLQCRRRDHTSKNELSVAVGVSDG